MQKQLQLLRDLQELDTEKNIIEAERQTGLDEQRALNVELERLQEMVDSLAEEVGGLENEKKELVNAMVLEQQNIERSEGRLPQIKTQKEYIAVLKEVDTAKKLAKELQDQIDAKNETLTSLSAEKTEKDEEFANAKQQTSERCAEIDASLVSVVEKLDEMERQRKVLLKDLPARLRKRYELLMSRRGGVAVVEARNGACLGCHMHLPPQLFNSLFVVKEVQTCPHCNRLLYVSEPG
ncbi:MAG: C4-type zinc ribbon domain-containing protein [Desulfuromonadales bacterium]